MQLNDPKPYKVGERGICPLRYHMRRHKVAREVIEVIRAISCKISRSRSPLKFRENRQNIPERGIIIKKSKINFDRHSIGFYILTTGAIDEGIDLY